MSQQRDRKVPKQLINTRKEFTTYLRNVSLARRTLSGVPRKVPRSSSFWANIRIKNSQTLRWESHHVQVKEHEVFDVILYFLQSPLISDCESLYRAVKKRSGGIKQEDVQKAWNLREEYNLGDLDLQDHLLWQFPVTKLANNLNSNSNLGLEASANTNRPQESHTTPSRRFHPTISDMLHVGTSGKDGKDVWLTMVTRYRAANNYHLSTFYNSTLRIKPETSLDIIWNDEFKLIKFPLHKHNEKKQKREQRLHFWNIIREHGANRNNITKKPQKAKLSTREPEELATFNRATPAKEIAKTTLPTPPKSGARSRKRRMSDAFEPSDSSDSDIPLRRVKPLKIMHRTTKSTPPIAPDTSDVEIISTKTVAQIGTSYSTPTRTLGAYTSPQDPSTGILQHQISASALALTTDAIAATSLLVSASNQPMRAAVNIPLSDCKTLDQLFQTLVIECNLNDKAAAKLKEVSATYKWDDEPHLIRKDRPRDWAIFGDTVSKAWIRDGIKFAEQGCKIKMLAHVDV